jgi:CRISPR system Cascade subunit CasC
MPETPRFIQIHFLTAYPASLLNRDDAGFAKRMPFGGSVRTRISSQCLKRHWRTFQGPNGLESVRGKEAMSVRSRYIFEQIAKNLREVFEPEKTNSMVQEVSKVVLNPGDSGSAKAEQTSSGLRTNQLIVLGYPEMEHLTNTARELLQKGASSDLKGIRSALGKEGVENLRAIGRGAGLDAALFGRMKTSDVLADCEAAVHVAHAFTVHEEHSETDYFTAVDDLAREFAEESGAGAGHVNAAELTTGLYYGYLAVDVPLLISNLEGVNQADWQTADKQLAGEVVERLIHLVATVSPGAKLGATAPYSLADFVAVESGDFQPCTWANAFFEPVQGPNLKEKSMDKLARHVRALDRMYQPGTKRMYATLLEGGLYEEQADSVEGLPGLAEWAKQCLLEGMK